MTEYAEHIDLTQPCTTVGWINKENGYAAVSVRNADGKLRRMLAHRATYIRAFGSISEGYQIDHCCHRRACSNIAHLEAVTPCENQRRAAEHRGDTAQHGTRSRYVGNVQRPGCRCLECKEAQRVYSEQYRAARKPTTTETDAA